MVAHSHEANRRGRGNRRRDPLLAHRFSNAAPKGRVLNRYTAVKFVPAGMAELADALDLGSSALTACRFKSCSRHQTALRTRWLGGPSAALGISPADSR